MNFTRVPIFILTLSLATSFAFASEKVLVGNFTNREFSKPCPCLGEEIELWKSPQGFFGHFYRYQSPMSDPEGGEIEKVKFNSVTKAFSFSTQPFRFVGIMNNGLIEGVVTNNIGESKKIVLKKIEIRE